MSLKIKIINKAIKIIQVISIALSFEHRQSLGIFLGHLVHFFSKKRSKITEQNLKNAFPAQSNSWINDIVCKTYNNLGITYLEFLAQKSFSADDLKNFIIYENPELISDVYSRGKGIILLSGHFGNWELLAMAGGVYSGIPMNIIVKPQKYGDEILNICRTALGNKIIDSYNSARQIINVIKSGGALAMLADQSATMDRDIFVEFFGRMAATYKAPAELALRFGTPLIIGFAERKENGQYYVRLSEIKHDDLTYSREAIYELTKRHVKILEDAIRSNPGLWAWQHRRWKHQQI